MTLKLALFFYVCASQRLQNNDFHSEKYFVDRLRIQTFTLSGAPKAMSFNMQPVTSQPMGFKANYLDSNSQSLYNSLNVKHMSGVDLTGRLNNAGNQLMETVQGRFVSLKGNMTYDELVTGLIYNDEQIISRAPHLQYASLSIYDESFNLKTSRTGGVAILTDKRMLFLSSQYVQSFTLKQFGDPKKLPGGYTMEMSCNDSTYYLPISLPFFRSIELDGRTGISGSIAVHGKKPPCNGWCGMCGCLKGWMTMPMNYAELNELNLTFGVLMPPWEHKTFLGLHLGSDAPMQSIRDLMSLFQGVAKNLR